MVKVALWYGQSGALVWSKRRFDMVKVALWLVKVAL
jgi:hypothetical protein